MDLHIHENLFSVHTKCFEKKDVFPSFFISVKLTVDPDFKTYLDNKPYYELSTVALELKNNRPLYQGSLTSIEVLKSSKNRLDLEDPMDISNFTLEKALYQGIAYQVESREQQVSIEEEIVTAIYTYYKRAIRIYVESKKPIRENVFFGRK